MAMSHIRQLASGNHRAELRDPAGRKYGRTFPTKALARAWAADEERRNRRGRHVDQRASRQRVRDYATTWQSDRVVERTTAANDRTRLDKHVLGEWGDWPLDTVTPSALRGWVKRMERSGLAPATVRSAGILFRAMLDAARVDGLLPDNPMRDVKLPAPPPGREVYLTQDDIDEVSAAMECLRPEAADFDQAVLHVLAYSGMRWGELVGLAVPQLDLLRRRLHVTGVVVEIEGRFERKPYPKRRKPRVVPLPEHVVDALAAHLRDHPAETDDLGALVFRPRTLGFAFGRGRALSRTHWPRTAFKPAVASALVRGDVRVHDLRHSYASWLVAAGRPLYEVSTLLGHGSITTTQRYAHFAPDHFDGIEEALTRGRRAADVRQIR